MARPNAAQPIAASAGFIKSRENFLSILQQEAQQPVRAMVFEVSFSRCRDRSAVIFVSGQKHWLLIKMRDARRDLRFGTFDL